MVHILVDLLANCSDSIDAIRIDELEQLVDLVDGWDSGDQRPQIFDEIDVLVVDAEEQEVEKGHVVSFDVSLVFADARDDLKVQGLLSVFLFLAQPIRFFETVGDLVVKVDLSVELLAKLLLKLLGFEVLAVWFVHWSHGIV